LPRVYESTHDYEGKITENIHFSAFSWRSIAFCWFLRLFRQNHGIFVISIEVHGIYVIAHRIYVIAHQIYVIAHQIYAVAQLIYADTHHSIAEVFGLGEKQKKNTEVYSLGTLQQHPTLYNNVQSFINSEL
jgi:hypothetical protein